MIHSHSITDDRRSDKLPGPLSRSTEAGLGAPRRTLVLALVVIVLAGLGLGRVVKEPAIDAFVPNDHLAAQHRDRARELFGIEDPVVVALIDSTGQSLFRPDALEALRRMHDAFGLVPGVRRGDLFSLAGENSITGIDGDLQVDPILVDGPIGGSEAAVARERFEAMPMLRGLLGSADGNALTLIVPVEDPNHAGEVYTAIRAIGEAEAPPGTGLHVAGVAGMNARLAETVDTDSRVLIPAAIVAVLLILIVSLRTTAGFVGPLAVIAASALVTIGLMGWLDARYYLITTALPVVIMAMAVADCLHLNVFYLRYRIQHADADHQHEGGGEAALVRPGTDWIGTVRVQKSLLQDTLTLRTEWISSLADGDGALRPSLDWAMNDSLRLGAGVDWLHGEREELFGQFRDQRRVWLRLKLTY